MLRAYRLGEASYIAPLSYIRLIFAGLLGIVFFAEYPDLATWIGKWQGKYPKLVDWVESNIIETLTFYRLPRAHHKHLKSTNMLERLNEEIKRRTLVVRIFPNTESCLRLIRALCVETHETWLEDNRYLNMTFLTEQKKEALRLAA